MASSAIVARLQLDSKDYDKKLAEAKKKTRDFSKGGGSDLAAMAGKFKTLAVAVASSKVAMEVFNRVIASSQTIGDSYTSAIAQCKATTDEFVYAMANADFSVFNSGLRGIRENAKKAAESMDSLGNAQISFDYLTAGYRSDFKSGMSTAKDKSLSLSERQAGYDAAQVALGSIKEAVDVYSEKVENAVADNAKAMGNNVARSFITRENIDKILALDITRGGEDEKRRLAAQYEQFKKLSEDIATYERVKAQAEKRGVAFGQEAKLQAMYRKLASEDMQMAALYNAMLVKGTDEWLQNMTSLVIKADNAKASYEELKTSSYEVANALGVAAQEAAKLEAESMRMKGFQPRSQKMATLPSMYLTENLDYEIEQLPIVTTSVEEYYKALDVLDATAVSASEGLGAIGGAISGMSGLLGEGEGAWISYVGSIVSAVGGALPALEALAAAQAAAAVTKTALNPWTVAAGVAAVGSIVAAMAAIPKFATGGVVPGNMMSGDNVLIRANSGEVVLTKQMAGNIGDALKGGLGGKVVFKIEGSTLVGVLNNHNRIAGRSYGYKNG